MQLDPLIRSAIANRQVIEFTYRGLHRVAEPHVYGLHKGKRQLLTYQIRGESSSGGLPNWRRVDVDDISDVQALHESFPGPRPTVSGEHSSFDEVIAIVR